MTMLGTAPLKEIVIPQPPASSRRAWLWGGAASLGIAVVLAGLQLRTPSVDVRTLWIEPVRQGDLHRDISGQGRLIPSRLIALSSDAGGVVTAIHAFAGSRVKAGEIIVDLSNAELQQRLIQAEKQFADEQADLATERSRLLSEELELKSKAADLADQVRIAQLELDATQELASKQIVSRIQLERAKLAAASAQRQAQDARSRLQQFSTDKRYREATLDNAARFGTQQVEGLRTQITQLQVRSPAEGIVYELADSTNEGTPVPAGAVIALVSTGSGVSAELNISAAQAAQVRSGQRATVRVGSTALSGHVARVDPQSVQDQIRVVITIDSKLSLDARPGLPVTGGIEVGTLQQVVYVVRPVGVSEGSSREVFVRYGDADELTLTPLRFGRSAGKYIEVLSEVSPGDSLVVGDMQGFAAHKMLRLDD